MRSYLEAELRWEEIVEVVASLPQATLFFVRSLRGENKDVNLGSNWKEINFTT